MHSQMRRWGAILTVTIILGGCGSDSGAKQAQANEFSLLSASPLLEYKGYYKCSQGITAFDLRVYSHSGDNAKAVFSFGPSDLNPDVPSGAYWVDGTLSPSNGTIQLEPDAWIKRPLFYVMVGVEGSSPDNGKSYSGDVVGGYSCTKFALSLTSSQIHGNPPLSSDQGVTSEPSVPPTAVSGTQQSTGTTSDEIQLGQSGGVFTVPVSINGVLNLDFVLDSGAADVSIPADVVLTLMRTGTISSEDFIGSQTYVLADGEHVPSMQFRIHKLVVGSHIAHDVVASVSSPNGVPLLGETFLARFGGWKIDNANNTLQLGASQ